MTELTHPPAPYGGDAEAWKEWVERLPSSTAMGLRCTSMDQGRATVVMEESSWPLNPNGAVHGGMVVAWADHCLGIASATTVPSGAAPATAALTAQFLRPAFPPLTFEARVERSGRTLTFAAVEVFDSHGRLVTKVTGTMSTDGASRAPTE